MDTESNKITSIFAPFAEITADPTVYKIGGTTYEVTSHFDTNGKETVLALG